MDPDKRDQRLYGRSAKQGEYQGAEFLFRRLKEEKKKNRALRALIKELIKRYGKDKP